MSPLVLGGLTAGILVVTRSDRAEHRLAGELDRAPCVVGHYERMRFDEPLNPFDTDSFHARVLVSPECSDTAAIRSPT